MELTSQETQLKNSLKQLETIYVNEIQLSLGEEFKSGNLKESKEIKNKKKRFERNHKCCNEKTNS